MKHDLDYMLQVMQAAKEGKLIEVKIGLEGTWEYCDIPCWDWDGEDYRIKPEKPQSKYVPYESAEEFLQAQREHGFYITEKERKYETCVMMVFESGIHIYDFQKSTPSVIHFIELFYKYTWQNGTPCGKLKQ